MTQQNKPADAAEESKDADPAGDDAGSAESVQATTAAAADAETAGTEAAGGQEEPPSEIDELRAQLEQANTKVDANWQLYLEERAEAENVRKRVERDLANAHKFALEKFVGELLPIKDSLEMGISAANETADVEQLKQGKELTLKMFTSTLEKFGVKEIDPAGAKFDPQQHEAMAMQPAADAEPNTVLQVVQKGYALNDRLVRPAMVVVAQAMPKTADEEKS